MLHATVPVVFREDDQSLVGGIGGRDGTFGDNMTGRVWRWWRGVARGGEFFFRNATQGKGSVGVCVKRGYDCTAVAVRLPFLVPRDYDDGRCYCFYLTQ